MPIKKFTVSRDDTVYEAWPDVILTPGGRLVAVFAECTHHLDRDYTRINHTHSDDRGRTWSAKQPLFPELRRKDPKDEYWNCPRISRLSSGKLLALVDRNRKGISTTTWFCESEDDGETWSEPRPFPVIMGRVPDKLLELRHGPYAGRWVVAGQGSKRVGEERVWQIFCHYSDDQGASWTGPVEVAAVQRLKLCEASVLELPEGELVCLMRENSNIGLDVHKAVSNDGGESWGEVGTLPIPACHRPVAGLLGSGKVMITFRLKHGGMKAWGRGQQNFMLAVTDPRSCLAEAREKAWCRLMPVDYDRSPDADCGYSGWVQFPDGEIFIISYIVDDAPLGQIRGYSLTEEDICLGDPAPGPGTRKFDATA